MLHTLRTRVLMAALLGVALLFAMSAGWQHRIAHARGKPADPLGAAHAHSCAAFDAAALADGLPTAPPALPGVAPAAPARPSPSPASRLAASVRLFDARGPPSGGATLSHPSTVYNMNRYHHAFQIHPSHPPRHRARGPAIAGLRGRGRRH